MIFSIYVVVFFFFKHKTAYEMRISDWSSDVCASDLWRGLEFFPRPGHPTRQVAWGPRPAPPRASQKTGGPAILRVRSGPPGAAPRASGPPIASKAAMGAARSEEHTSELQSLMRISYAVFCLKYNMPHFISTNNTKTTT